ncbi:MAG: hypothetical protein ORN28_05725 [Rhodoferax sp.]|nr:hypothetical protein [Rhodoferax sp.]
MAEDVNAAPDNGPATPLEMVGGLVANLSGLLAGARAVVGGQLLLLALEARRAGRALVTMLACGIAAGILLAGFWLGCTAALVLWLMERGYAASTAMLAASVWDLLGVLVLLLWLNRLSQALAFPASVQSLRTGKSEDIEKDAP